MSHSNPSIPSPREVLRLLASRPKAWLVPAAAIALLAAVYAVVRPDSWQASQALIVRNEAVGSDAAPGKFRQIEEMKTIQETILELARSRSVLRAALEEVGPPAGYRKAVGTWPTDEDVETLRGSVKLAPPKGAEFGKTEIFYLEVRDGDRSRSLALSRAICSKLGARFAEVRDAKASSMIDELAGTVRLAQADLDESTARLTAMETEVGSDLSELRSLHERSAADGALQRTVGEIRSELRQVRAALETNRQLLTLLDASHGDTGRLLAAPNQLLESQPALRRLKEGLVDAQLRTATLRGTMSNSHPLVKAAVESEEEVGRHLHAELAIALRGVEAEANLNHQREALLEEQLAAAERRLAGLAAVRATYTNLVVENASRASLVERAERDLAEARAILASAKATSLIDRVDDAHTGTRPVGPSRAAIVLLGIVGGLATGLGVVLLGYTAPQAAAEAPTATAAPAGVPASGSNGKHYSLPNRKTALTSALERLAVAART